MPSSDAARVVSHATFSRTATNSLRSASARAGEFAFVPRFDSAASIAAASIGPFANTLAASSTWRSSRTFPGQARDISDAIASAVTRAAPAPRK